MIMELVIPSQLTCILISAHTFSASFDRSLEKLTFLIFLLLLLQSAPKDSASSDFLCSKLFLKRKRPTYIKVKMKIAFNAAKIRTTKAKRIKSQNGDFNKVWPPAWSRPIRAQKDQVISLHVLRKEPFRWPFPSYVMKGKNKKTLMSFVAMFEFLLTEKSDLETSFES